MSELRFKQALVLIGLAMLIAFVSAFPSALRSTVSAESAALGMTIGELETFRADLAAKAKARDSHGMADVLLPVLKNSCRLQLPGAPPKATCDLFLK